jgi:hypothetical protein
MAFFVRVTSVSVFLAVMAANCGATTIIQTNPDTSLVATSWGYGGGSSTQGSADSPSLTATFKSPTMIDTPLMLQFTLDAGDLGGRQLQLSPVINNQTGLAWSDFHLIVVNLPSALPEYCNASFTDLGGVTSDVFGAPTSAAGNEIDFTNGTLPSGQGTTIGGLHITFGNAQIGDVFYIKAIPTPEPATLSLLAIMLGGLVMRRNKKQ